MCQPNEFFYPNKNIADTVAVILEASGFDTNVSRCAGSSEFKLTTSASRETVVATNTEFFSKT